MIKTEMVKALNEQINKEMYSAYLYMSMSAYSNKIGLKGFANWFMVQYHEEMYHAMKMYEYVQRQGEDVTLETVASPPNSFESPLDMFTQTLSHEQFITQSINDLMDLALNLKDHATRIFLEWYVTEQIEEEENDNDIILELNLIGDDPRALLMLDKDLAARLATIPTDFSKGVEAAESAAA